MITDPLFYAAAIPAVIILGLAKGGFAGLGILAVPLMALAASPVQAASITLPILIAQDVVSLWAFRRAWDGGILVLMLPSAAAGIAAGYALAAFVSTAAVELSIGLLSVSFAALRLWGDRNGFAAAPAPSRLAGALWGVVAGFASQIAHAGGPPFQIYVLPKRLPRDVFIGTGALFFAAVNLMKVPAYAALGQFTSENLATAGALMPLAIVATAAGVWLIRHVPVERFYTLIYTLLLLVGAKLMWDGAVGLMATP